MVQFFWILVIRESHDVLEFQGASFRRYPVGLYWILA
jgi:hypothetical protein